MKCYMISKYNLNRFLVFFFNVNVEKRLFLKLNFLRTTFLAYFIMFGPMNLTLFVLYVCILPRVALMKYKT